MKKLAVFLTMLAMTVQSSWADDKKEAKDKAPSIRFEQTSHDFGSIPEEGGPVSCTFDFFNDGDAPLVIISVSAQCGCTRPSFPQKPIAPGKKGEIKVKYLPQGRPGEFIKEVKVKCNDKKHRTAKLKISGVVIPYRK